jgi:hypothetical protein
VGVSRVAIPSTRRAADRRSRAASRPRSVADPRLVPTRKRPGSKGRHRVTHGYSALTLISELNEPTTPVPALVERRSKGDTYIRSGINVKVQHSDSTLHTVACQVLSPRCRRDADPSRKDLDRCWGLVEPDRGCIVDGDVRVRRQCPPRKHTVERCGEACS